MENRYNDGSQSPRYMEIGLDGQVLRQANTVPHDVVNYLNSPNTRSYNGVSTKSQWSAYSYQVPNKQEWWRPGGSFNPYRTSYQDYGPTQKQSNSNSNVFYTQPNLYRQNSYINNGNWNSSTTAYRSGRNSVSYSPSGPQQYWFY